MIEVVAALIWREDRFLICQRPAQKARGLLWEFVGGKVEPQESRRQALIRECQEELAVTVDVGELFWEGTYAYPDVTVHLAVYQAAIVQGEIQKREHADLRWIAPEQIPQFLFCPADMQVLEQIRQQYGRAAQGSGYSAQSAGKR